MNLYSKYIPQLYEPFIKEDIMNKQRRKAIIDIIKPLELNDYNDKVIDIIIDCCDYFKYGFLNNDENADKMNIGYWQGKYYAISSVLRELFQIEVFCCENANSEDGYNVTINICKTYNI